MFVTMTEQSYEKFRSISLKGKKSIEVFSGGVPPRFAEDLVDDSVLSVDLYACNLFS
jgi:hypothetical protein